MAQTKNVVISVGGSLIVPDGIDIVFLSKLRAFVEKHVASGTRFVLITGGGKIARRYQDAARAVRAVDPEDVDWLGIHATRFNAHLLRTILRDLAHPSIIGNPDDVTSVPLDVPVIVGAGYKPGSSTDLRAVQVAKNLGARQVVNLSNIDHAYTADPREDPQAQKIESMSWDEFIALVPAEWSPGLSSPFDPVASREAKTAGIEVAIINGNKLEEVEKYLNGQKFIGSVIR